MKSKVQHILALELNIIIWERIQKYNDIEKIEMYSLKSMNAITKKLGLPRMTSKAQLI